jgi:3-isopropylmalate dehydrogenase
MSRCTARPRTSPGRARPTRSPVSCRFAMALRYSFDLGDEADRLEKAVEAVLADGLRTADLLGEDG